MQQVEFTVIFIKYNCFEIKSVVIEMESRANVQDIKLAKTKEKTVPPVENCFACDLHNLR